MKHPIGTRVKVIQTDETATEFIDSTGIIIGHENAESVGGSEEDPLHKVRLDKMVKNYGVFSFWYEELQIISQQT